MTSSTRNFRDLHHSAPDFTFSHRIRRAKPSAFGHVGCVQLSSSLRAVTMMKFSVPPNAPVALCPASRGDKGSSVILSMVELHVTDISQHGVV
jgi:hypothetical protein